MNPTTSPRVGSCNTSGCTTIGIRAIQRSASRCASTDSVARSGQRGTTPCVRTERTPSGRLWLIHRCKTRRMALDPDDNDSPFAHVPAQDAGPGPLQDGPFTYEKLVASTGRGTIRVGSGWWRVV